MIDQVESGNFSIVAVGPLSPLSFMPGWFEENGLVGKDVAASATSDGSGAVFAEDVAKFRLGVVDLLIQKDRLQVVTTREDGVATMVDLFCGLAALVEPLKLSSLGMNFSVQYRTGSEKGWHRAGDLLAGKDFWNKAWPRKTGLLNLQLVLPRQDDLIGAINVQVQPSPTIQFGIFVNINDHLDFTNGINGKEVSDLVGKEWQSARDRSEQLITTIIKESLSE